MRLTEISKEQFDEIIKRSAPCKVLEANGKYYQVEHKHDGLCERIDLASRNDSPSPTGL